MSDANAKSSTRKTSFKEEVEKIKIVMGPFKTVLNDKEYTLKMDPEYAKDFSVEMMELAIPVGTHTNTLDKNGKITKRIDAKTGKEFVMNTKNKTKSEVKKSITEKQEK